MGETIRTALMRKVFSDHESRHQFDANLARVCVLFEDLRIEIRGITERSLPALDILDPEGESWLNPGSTGRYRTFYFLRRSILTLNEFADAIGRIVRDMDKYPTLRPNFTSSRARPGTLGMTQFSILIRTGKGLRMLGMISGATLEIKRL
jgi:hypothetical protein